MSLTKYNYNELIDYLEIDPQFISKGIEYAKNNNFDSIRIRTLNRNAGQTYDINLSSFDNQSFIRQLKINDDFKIKKLLSVESLYSIQNLKLLSFKDKSFKLDFSKIPQLETLYFKYNKGVSNLGALKNLNDLLIFSLNVPNCKKLSELSNLEMLRLTRGNFTTLQGIENLKKVKRFDVAYNSKLTDAKAISSLSCLEKLHIEKCKLLTDFSFLEGNTSIKELFIDNLDSIDFVSSMPNLEKINFWDCKDGNMKPLLESKSLKQINFYPNKKHYTHTIEEIIEITGVQRGRNK